jgi:hypothetical protein
MESPYKARKALIIRKGTCRKKEECRKCEYSQMLTSPVPTTTLTKPCLWPCIVSAL